MPKTVLDQEGKFKRDEILKKLSEFNKVRYTNINSSDIQSVKKQLMKDIDEGYINIAYVESGINLKLNINTFLEYNSTCELDETTNAIVKDNSIELKSRFILNGVCVIWKGEISLKTLEGLAKIEFDYDMAKEEYLLYRNQLEDYSALFGLDNLSDNELSLSPISPPSTHFSTTQISSNDSSD